MPKKLTMRNVAPINTAFIFTSRSIGTVGKKKKTVKQKKVENFSQPTLDSKVVSISEVLFSET